MKQSVADLHCDLLDYLHRNPTATPFDEEVRCSIPQLKKGNVGFQGLAIFCSTNPISVERGMGQAIQSDITSHTFVASHLVAATYWKYDSLLDFVAPRSALLCRSV